MQNHMLLYIGSVLTIIWGIAHLFPTKSVVQGFGDISIDNRHIITMEWITEGVALIFIGALVGVVTIVDPNHEVSTAVYTISVIGLIHGSKFLIKQAICPSMNARKSLISWLWNFYNNKSGGSRQESLQGDQNGKSRSS